MKNVFKTVGFAAVAAFALGTVQADDQSASVAASQNAVVEVSKVQDPETAKRIQAAQKAAAELAKDPMAGQKAFDMAKELLKDDPEMVKKIEAAQKEFQSPEMQKKIASIAKAVAAETPEGKKHLELTVELQKVLADGDTEKAKKIQAEINENTKKITEAALDDSSAEDAEMKKQIKDAAQETASEILKDPKAASQKALEMAKTRAKDNPELSKQLEAVEKALQSPEMQKKMTSVAKAIAEETPEGKKHLELTLKLQKAVTSGDTEEAKKIQVEINENAKRITEAAEKVTK